MLSTKNVEGSFTVIHQYINNDIPIVLDVNSGSVHVVDQLVYDAIARMDEGKSLYETIDELKSTYGPDEIREAWEECQTLKEQGILFTEDVY